MSGIPCALSAVFLAEASILASSDRSSISESEYAQAPAFVPPTYSKCPISQGIAECFHPFASIIAICCGVGAERLLSPYKSIARPVSWLDFPTSAIWCPAARNSAAVAQGIPTLFHISLIVCAWSRLACPVITGSPDDCIADNAELSHPAATLSTTTFLLPAFIVVYVPDGVATHPPPVNPVHPPVSVPFGASFFP